MDKRLLPLLPYVEKPARYIGGELNARSKDWDAGMIKVALAFPDIYDLGMSYLGFKILYELINGREDALAERVYLPWIDLQARLEQGGIPLTASESGRELVDFDFVGFTLQYELNYSNVIRMLDLAGIPRRSRQRSEDYPLVMAGGPCAFNVEPLADFLDFVVLGEGEEVIQEILDLALNNKGESREGLLSKLAELDGIYVPGYYRPVYGADGSFSRLQPLHSAAPAQVRKRVLADFNQTALPRRPVVPFAEVVHDRAVLEIMRGCTRGCRFCQAGMIYRPVREKSSSVLLDQARQLLEATGYDEISLSSLSSGDYSQIGPLAAALAAEFERRNVGISLPSLRLDSFGVELAQEIQRTRRTGLTFAPEAGTQRLRNVINKNVTDQDLKQVAQAAFSAGWHGIKLYFMIGLPTETWEDLNGIADLARRVLAWGREFGTSRRRPEVTVSAASFVPKPHTPFQWAGQDPMDVLGEKQDYLKRELRHPGIRFTYPAVQESFLEAVLARGDRRLGPVLERAVDLGCQFDSWSDQFSFDLWMRAFQECGVEPRWYAERERSVAEALPWSHLGAGIDSGFLQKEWGLALQTESTEDCRWHQCSNCGVCPKLGVSNQLSGGGS